MIGLNGRYFISKKVTRLNSYFSNSFLYYVSVSPVCATNEVTIIGGSIEEVLHIRCHVAADPTNVTISWQFTSSEKSHPLTTGNFRFLNDTVSELVYKVNSDRDYGTVTCSADNVIGRQVDACIFQIVPAGEFFE